MKEIIDKENFESNKSVNYSGEIQSTLQEINAEEQKFEAALKQANISDNEVFKLTLAYREALVNAFKHGHGENPNKKIQFKVKVTPQAIEFKVTDQGQGFKLENIAEPTAPENLLKTSGRGLLLLQTAGDISFNEAGNEITFKWPKQNF